MMPGKSSFIAAAVAAALTFNVLGAACGKAVAADAQGVKHQLSPGALDCKDCNLIIISLTSTRKDRLGIYGYKRNTSPNLDGFFRNSIIFEKAFAPTGWTMPNAASLFTSLSPYTHGVMDRVGGRLGDKVKTFALILKENGYSTAAFTGAGDYDRKFNFDRGFDLYIDGSNYPGFGLIFFLPQLWYLSAKPLIPPAIEWIEKNKDKKFFLFLQGYDNHCPFNPKPPFNNKFDPDYQNSEIDYEYCMMTTTPSAPVHKDGKSYQPVHGILGTLKKPMMQKDFLMGDRDVSHLGALYDEKVSETDSDFKAIFKYIEESGLLKNTIVVFMSEHGDILGEHGIFMRFLPSRGHAYGPVSNFPFLLRHPKTDSPVKVDELIQMVDLLPTFTEMLQLKDPDAEKRSGKSAVPSIISGKAINEYVYGGLDFDVFTGQYIRSKDWKLIREENRSKELVSYELYNISADPLEVNNLISSKGTLAEGLKAKLSDWVKTQKQ